MAGDIRVWNEPVIADFNTFYFILSGGTEEDHKSLTISCLQGCEAGTNFMYNVLKFDTNQLLYKLL